jgi:hypothetical protein
LADHALCKMVRYVLLRPLRPEIGRQLFKYLWLPSKLSRLLDSSRVPKLPESTRRNVNKQYLIRAHCSIITVTTTELDCAHQSASRMMSPEKTLLNLRRKQNPSSPYQRALY